MLHPDVSSDLVDATEAILFAADDPVPPNRIVDIVADVTGPPKPKISAVEAAVDQLNAEYAATGRSLRIQHWAGGFRMTTHASVSPFVERLFVDEQQTTLSRSLLETLAVVAYRQPVTRPEVDFVRGVNSDYALRKLLDMGLTDVKGRADSLGRPLLYGTTARFLEQFGLNTLQDLPTLREVRELLDDPNFDEERAQLLQLNVEEAVVSDKTAGETADGEVRSSPNGQSNGNG
mgnify:CR=1 FL=1